MVKLTPRWFSCTLSSTVLTPSTSNSTHDGENNNSAPADPPAPPAPASDDLSFTINNAVGGARYERSTDSTDFFAMIAEPLAEVGNEDQIAVAIDNADDSLQDRLLALPRHADSGSRIPFYTARAQQHIDRLGRTLQPSVNGPDDQPDAE
ncbi:hypothetical protein QBC43DRAFT_304620 [Cladorrhinum sp. PSN259]|nr:hypothetical protein QBC43DRAFT_304620 [Cladorrhinum sp. PSN259]